MIQNENKLIISSESPVFASFLPKGGFETGWKRRLSTKHVAGSICKGKEHKTSARGLIDTGRLWLSTVAFESLERLKRFWTPKTYLNFCFLLILSDKTSFCDRIFLCMSDKTLGFGMEMTRFKLMPTLRPTRPRPGT